MDSFRNALWEIRCAIHNAWLSIRHSFLILEEGKFLADRTNVILLYGFGGLPGCLVPIKEKLESLGYNILIPNLGRGTKRISVFARRLRIFLRKKEAPLIYWNSRRLEDLGKDLIFFGHSMGGLVALELLREYPEYRSARVIALGTPLRGTNFAYLSSVFFSASRDLIPGSDFLKRMHEYLMENLPDLYQVRAWYDEIAPRSSTALPEFPAYTLSSVAGHAALLYLDRETLQYVLSKQ